jgi:cytochrome c oxidase assembly protein subunit 15
LSPSERHSSKRPNHHLVVAWLYVLAGMIFAMVVIGGLTRLTESGLSMVEWRPATGWLPPLSDAAWQAEFEKYQAFPQYQLLNQGMALEDFKNIYWPEYLHRLMGRVIGLAFALPFIWFALTRRLPSGMAFKLGGIFALGAAQGALGWFMVLSGLVDAPAVSHYRLVAHLGLAILLYGLILSTAWSVAAPQPDKNWHSAGLAVSALIFLQILVGGLVAGLDAGQIHNTWPSMDGAFLPDTAIDLEPAWRNFFDNPSMVQFEHRMLGYLASLAVVGFGISLSVSARNASRRRLGAVLLAVLIGQMILGIVTVLQGAPAGIAALHQTGALVLLTVALMAARRRSAGG